MIIATAGHVDHGKTSLIRSLTGVETDRLAEEKRRGLSISLGYAYLARESGTPIGFIDVPGHQRFINNMISGISGIDLGMLVIAADDGPMPQTLEHLDVLRLLGVGQLLVVISKTDRVDPDRLAMVRRQIGELLTGYSWKNTAVFPVSAIDGDGVAALKNHLLKCADNCAERKATGWFRLSIDRAFNARGAGLIVTGTAAAGRISAGDSLVMLPAGVEVRIRGIRVHDQPADSAAAGQRCALNIVGKLEAAAITRGNWLVQRGAPGASSRLDVAFSLLESAPFPVKNQSPVKLYIGAARVPGRIALLDTDSESNRLLPGKHCLAQLVMGAEVACFRGERFLLRDQAENVILGGGTILDPNGPGNGRARPERIQYLMAMKADNPALALTRLVEQNRLVNLEPFSQAWNLRQDETAGLHSVNGRFFETEGGQWAISTAGWHRADAGLMEYLDRLHRDKPELPGPRASELKSALRSLGESVLLIAVLTSRLRSGDLVLSEGRISRAGFKPAVSAESAAQWQAFKEVLEKRGKLIPLLSEVSAETGITAKALEQIARKAAKTGNLHCLNSRRYALPAQLHALAIQTIATIDEGAPVTVIEMKSRFGAGRNLTVEILEYFDSIRFTRRQGNARVLIDPGLPERLFNG